MFYSIFIIHNNCFINIKFTNRKPNRNRIEIVNSIRFDFGFHLKIFDSIRFINRKFDSIRFSLKSNRIESFGALVTDCSYQLCCY